MKILIPEDYQNAVSKLKCLSLLDEHEVHILGDTNINPVEFHSLLSEAEVLVPIRERTRITAEFLKNCPSLKLISQTGKISGHIDVAACSREGIAIAEGIGSPVAPAELTWSLIMNSTRLLPAAIQAMKDGNWQVNIGRAIRGQTIGIWSYGRIGQLIASYAKAFEAKVIVWGSEKARSKAAEDGFAVAETKNELLSAVDILSLHIRLTDSTRGMITADDLSLMKPGSLLVNTSRAELIQPGALIKALSNGRPGFAALDVFEQEPIALDDPLLKMPNVLCTPHLGYVEWQSYELYFEAAFRNILAFASGMPENIVNQEVLNY
jgi:D-3-phosphoglycerate dehydrogenase / 2-oxoglutarate reductase